MDSEDEEVQSAPLETLHELDLSVVRAQRAELESVVPVQEVVIPIKEESVSELGRAVRRVLFNPDFPHPHMVNFKENLDAFVERMIDLPIGENLEDASTFFELGRSKYAFPSDPSLPPVVVMKSLEEVENARRMHNRVLGRCHPSLISRIRESLKKKKSKDIKVSKEQHKETPHACDDDLDIFGGIDVPTPLEGKTSVVDAGNLFASKPILVQNASVTSSKESDIASEEYIKEVLLRKAAVREQQQTEQVRSTSHNLKFADDDIFPSVKLEFGLKPDLSRFALDASTTTTTKKQKLGQEKQVFNEVMKRLTKDAKP
jgi:hypothetical protein